MENQNIEIMIVDDNPDNLKVLSLILKQENYSVRAAQNGKQALESILNSEPDLILLDVNMPEMNGIEVCTALKSNHEFEDLPVIFLSALDDSFNKVQGFKAGAVDYITKPFDADEVKIRIKIHLKLRQNLNELKRLRSELARKDKELQEFRQKK